jgi:NAD(P)-dependent dehydrogenase (short-subunit alcohol dehydrogenase family)
VSYTAAKHASVGFIRHAAMALDHYSIRSNAVVPSAIMTLLITMALSVPQEEGSELTRYIDEHPGVKQATGRNGTRGDVASAALFLASDFSANVNGAVPVDGGISSYTLSTSDRDSLRIANDFLAQR